MFLKSIITGSVITAILIVVLVSSRLMRVETEDNDVVLTEVETVYFDPPPEPELDEPEEAEELEPVLVETQMASIPALDLLMSEKEMPALPESKMKFDPKLANVSIEMPELDRAPAPLPVKAKPISRPTKKATTKPKNGPKTTPKNNTKPKVNPKPKEYYGKGELDSLPRELRVGSFSWPSRARGKSGTVRLLLEINTSGRVRVVSVISSTDAQLTIAAKRVATGSRFTAPKKNGKAVKARYPKTYQLKKPR